ncbi:MAG: hypothetical protein ACTS5I_09860 [Rhodanobacter sp.]
MADLHRFPSVEKVVEMPHRGSEDGLRVLDLSDGCGEVSLLKFHRAVRAFCDEPRTFTDEPNDAA